MCVVAVNGWMEFDRRLISKRIALINTIRCLVFLYYCILIKHPWTVSYLFCVCYEINIICKGQRRMSSRLLITSAYCRKCVKNINILLVLVYTLNFFFLPSCLHYVGSKQHILLLCRIGIQHEFHDRPLDWRKPSLDYVSANPLQRALERHFSVSSFGFSNTR